MKPLSLVTRHLPLVLTACLAACVVEAPAPVADAAVGTNVVVILADDLGWADTGAYGSEFYDTPQIDRLASSGMRFTEFYTAGPVCSPARASILTGKYPARLKLTNSIGGEQNGRLLQADYVRQLPADEVTLGEAFREAGYATAYIGKWHLGSADRDRPGARGFDAAIAVNRAGQPASYFHPYRGVDPAVQDVPDLAIGADGEYLTDRLTTEAVRFLDEHAADPFLLVLSHYAAHTPLESKPSLTEKYRVRAAALPAREEPLFLAEGERGTTKQRQDHPAYAGMLESLDESVGRILDALVRLSLDRRTVVVFLSDTGGLSTLSDGRETMPTANLPLRAGQGWLYEGGIRVPLIVRWPAEVSPRAVSRTAAISTDLYPTLLDIAGLDPRPDQHRDGLSLVPVLRGEALERDALFWHFPHYDASGSPPSGAIRDERYKLIEWFEDERVELYDIDADPGERVDLAGDLPGTARELQARLHDWRDEVQARMPTPNPEWRDRRR